MSGGDKTGVEVNTYHNKDFVMQNLVLNLFEWTGVMRKL